MSNNQFNEQQVHEIIARVGVTKAGQLVTLTTNLGALIDAPPTVALALLAKAPQEDLENAKTPKEVFRILLDQFWLYTGDIFDTAQELQDWPELDLSFVKEFAEATGVTGKVAVATAEVLAEAPPRTFELHQITPGSDTLN